MDSKPLAAKCIKCGGTVPISLQDRNVTCPFCGTGDPLPGKVVDQIASVKRNLVMTKIDSVLKGKKCFLWRMIF